MEFEFWEPILILDDKTQFTESRKIFGYYYRPDPNKDAPKCSWVFIKECGLLSRSILHHTNRPSETNSCMVPVSGEIKEESSKFERVNFIYDNEVKDGTDDTLLTISYKYAIYTINHVNDIIDHNIIIRKKSATPGQR